MSSISAPDTITDLNNHVRVGGTLNGSGTLTNLTATGTVIFSNLPTSDPAVAGQLWADSGVVTVSAG